MQLFVDMDQVLVQFVAGSCKAHGRGVFPHTCWSYFIHDWCMAVKEFWEPIDADPLFWLSLDPFPWKEELVRLISHYDSEFMILSCPQESEFCDSGKKLWVREHLEISNTVDRVVLTSQKHLLSGPDRILIDDSPANISAWELAGGRGILFPDHHNENKIYLNDPVAFVAGELRKAATE